jgi:hypothetical protein
LCSCQVSVKAAVRNRLNKLGVDPDMHEALDDEKIWLVKHLIAGRTDCHQDIVTAL